MRQKPNRSSRTLLALAVLTAALPYSFAQEDEEDVFTLSPFTVDASDDVGYAATSTLAGSRLNSNLEDIANSVSVFTPEFMEDIGAVDEADLMAYSSSAVVEATEQTGAVLGGSFVGTGFQFRLRGMVASRTRDYFESFIPGDTYNSGRFDEARGANSILFGIGGAGGILNTTTKKAIPGRDFGSVGITAGIDNYDSLRSTLDYNWGINEKFAVRLNGLWQDSDKWRDYEFKNDERINLAATYKLAEKTTLRASYENVNLVNTHNRDFVAKDRISAWTENGSTLVTNPNQGPQAAIGIKRYNNGTKKAPLRERIIYVDDDQGWRNTQGLYFTDSFTNNDALLDFELAPLDAYYSGPGNFMDSEFDNLTVALEAEPIDNLFVELAYNKQDRDSIGYDLGQEAYAVRGEPSPFWFGNSLENRETNEYQGDLFVEGNWNQSIQLWDTTNYRATAAYELNTKSDWTGRHVIAALWSQSERNRYRVGSKLGVDDPIAGNPEAGRNRVFARNYIQNPGNASEYFVPSWENMSTIQVDRDGDGTLETIGTQWATNSLSDDTRKNTGQQLSSQSFLFRDRVIFTMGYREEEVDESVRTALDPETGATLRDPETGLKIFSEDYTELSRTVDNFSYGVVGEVTDWLRVLYNNSENFDIPGNSLGLIPDNSLRPVLEGISEEYGVMLKLLDNRVSIRAAYYENTSANDARGFSVEPNVIARNDRILDEAIAQDLIGSSEADLLRYVGSTWDLADKETSGWELSMTANPTENWRFTMNVTSSETVETNMLQRTRALKDDMLATWTGFGLDLPIPGVDGRTIASEIENFNDWFRDMTAVEGLKSYGHRDFQARLFTRYDFNDGPLKGFYIGGGYRYSDAPFVGILQTADISDELRQDIVETGATIDGREIYGFDTSEVDLLFGYKTKVNWLGDKKKEKLSIQLNLKDLLQENDYSIVRIQDAGNMTRARVVAPTKVSLSAKLSF
ncbi:TonB-dependent receptor [Pelagicoccus mobilis]|uniref:TonB-dependent receptor n=1 Tax=Pelagicoccus mobilis TaxID=415221 RepID=A0A934S5H1_9BACT|nr:TonB-dependent receptor [Pelagicoccus mobilis]MBK1879759.1 TonB-dependent receptor [Pelagicoccus mobilis]